MSAGSGTAAADGPDNFAHLDRIGRATQRDVMRLPDEAELASRAREIGMSEDALHYQTGSLSDLAAKVVFGDLWNRPGMSRRERRLITLTVLAVQGQLQAHGALHIEAALDSGDLTADELRETAVQMAYYAGWPLATSFEWAVDAAERRRMEAGDKEADQ